MKSWSLTGCACFLRRRRACNCSARSGRSAARRLASPSLSWPASPSRTARVRSPIPRATTWFAPLPHGRVASGPRPRLPSPAYRPVSGPLDLASAWGDLSQGGQGTRPTSPGGSQAPGTISYRLAVVAGHRLCPGVTGAGDTIAGGPSRRAAREAWVHRRRTRDSPAQRPDLSGQHRADHAPAGRTGRRREQVRPVSRLPSAIGLPPKRRPADNPAARKRGGASGDVGYEQRSR